MRERAERTLRDARDARDANEESHPLPRDTRAIIYELQVHEIELKMQNEALREANLELELAHTKYRDLYEAAPIAYVTLDANATILDANQMALQLFELPRQAVLGANLGKFVSPEHARVFNLHRTAVREQHKVVHCKLDLVLSSGVRQARLESLRDGEESSRWRVAIIDETPARELERVTRDHAFVSSVLDSAGFVVLLDGRGRIVRVNRACQRVLCGDDVLGLDFWDVFCVEQEREVTQARIETQLQTCSAAEWEADCNALDGSEHSIGWSLTVLNDDSGAFSNLIVLGTDLTERKRIEAQLLVADRLAAMGTLAAGVGHEINNPLAYLICALEVAARTATRLTGTSAADIERMREVLGTAHEGAQRIREIVDELRSLSRSGGRAREAVEVRAVLDSCVQIAAGEIRHRARLVKTYADVPLVHANRGRLGQVFLNLIINAAQAIPPGETEDNEIRLRVQETLVGQERKVVIEVEDTGAGIDPEDRDHVFDPFFTTKPVGEGVGLGLSVCHSIVSELGGQIDVESEPGQRTTFRVTLPAIAQVEAPSERTMGEASSPKRALRILIVDDETKLVDTLAELLQMHDVATAATCQAALDLCRNHNYDVIFCDVQMPDLAGEDFHRKLMKLRPGSERRIVFMTAGAFTHPARDLIAKAPNRLLLKPFSTDEMMSVIDDVMTERFAHN